MDASPVAESPFSLLGFGYEVPGAGTAGIGDPLLASSLAQVATSMDVLSAFASPDASPDVVPSLGELLQPAAPAPPAAQDATFGRAVAGYVSSPDELLPVAALLFDSYG